VTRTGSRPIGIRKETRNDRRWRWHQTGPLGWLWRCRVCNLEATCSSATLPDTYTAALDHLGDEHLATAA
jgi:hypothetical protein